MPNVTLVGIKSHTDEGWKFLNFHNETKTFLFGGTALANSVTLEYQDDLGVWRTIANGTITVLPTSIVIGPLQIPVRLNSAGGTPNFNVTLGAEFLDF